MNVAPADRAAVRTDRVMVWMEERSKKILESV